jgi:hypothetical protein
MPNGNWKSLALLCGAAALAVALLVFSLDSLWSLTTTGYLYGGVLLALTIAAGRFTVPLTNADGTSHSSKSMADALIFLAAMLFGAAPAAILSGVDGFISSWRSGDRLQQAFRTISAVIATSLAVFVYNLLTLLTVGSSATGWRADGIFGKIDRPSLRTRHRAICAEHSGFGALCRNRIGKDESEVFARESGLDFDDAIGGRSGGGAFLFDLQRCRRLIFAGRRSDRFVDLSPLPL